MVRGRKRVLLCAFFIIFLMSGCASSFEPKSPTEHTPSSQGARNNFEMIVAQSSAETVTITSDLKVGFVYVGVPGDFGYSFAQNEGRLAVMRELGVETFVEESIYGEETLNAIQRLIDRGCTIIFATSFGHMEYALEMAEQNPDVKFFHCSGYELRDNFSVYFGRIYQVRYLSGIVAGLRTETNQIGYILPFPIAECVRGLNAFSLGVQSVNPDAVIEIRWSETWGDAAIERELALELIDAGCDVIAQHQDTIAAQVAAEERGVWSIGYNSPMGFSAPNAYLTGAIWNWGVYMVDQVRHVKDGTWQSSNYWGGLEDDVVRLDELTINVAPGTAEAVQSARTRIQNGFTIFEGPIYDNQGVLRVAEGVVLTDAEKLALDWLMSNVRGQME